ncbi:MAG: 16S rRNA (guanine(527)-N(7))-methyltransferase RsmG [Clostridia bacterium]|nr:16S rRNA (guanine(527)-N(7))-methyltransferase RsmG [Clostridia bacterium]
MTIDKAEFSDKFAAALNINGLSEFSAAELTDKFHSLTERMLTVNEYMNLTAITELDGVILKHYVDSLAAAKYMPVGASVIDVGCGAGFPSLPLAIARPDLHVTALDSTAKRIGYIRETAEMLDIANITCIAARAEEAANDPTMREQYDISCARAVARLNVLCELCIPYVKPNGKFIAMKANSAEELDEAATAIKKLGGKLTSADSFSIISEINGAEDPRCIITIEKISETPKIYPRNNSQIKKKPL